MNVLIAIDSFKGSLTSKELAEVIESGIKDVSPIFITQKVPIADGGEGTTEVLLDGLGGKTIEITVKNPLFEDIIAEYGILDNKTAVIEIASSAGVTLIDDHLRNPMVTTTYGVGQMINDAIDRGFRSFIIGLGGSATNDGGIGMLAALGYRFLDKSGNELSPVGASLIKIDKVDTSNVPQSLDQCKFLIACDVDNPLYGIQGAAHVYARQKGATEEDILELDKGLINFSNIIHRDFNIDISKVKGSGAAGGLGGGFKAFLNGELKPGVEILFDLIKLEEKIKWADIIIIGEGRLDYQTAMGKAPIGVSRVAREHGKTVIALAGSITDDAVSLHDQGITSMFSIIDAPMTLDEAMESEKAKRMVKKKVVEIFRLILASDKLS